MLAADFDRDRDGFLDVLSSDKGYTCKLFLYAGGLTFTDVSAAAGITRSSKWRHCGAADTDMGHESADLDADGYPDLLLGAGNP